MRHPRQAAPPLIARPAASAMSARAGWDAIEAQLEASRRFVAGLASGRGRRAAYDRSYAALERVVRELDRYARAVRWALAVEDQSDP